MALYGVRYLLHNVDQVDEEVGDPRQHVGRQLEDAGVDDVVDELRSMLL